MGALITILGWSLLAMAISFLVTRLLVAFYRRKQIDAQGRVVAIATVLTATVIDLLLFQGDLLRADRWGSEGKGAYLWWMFPVATVFFLTVAGATSGSVLCMRRN